MDNEYIIMSVSALNPALVVIEIISDNDSPYYSDMRFVRTETAEEISWSQVGEQF